MGILSDYEKNELINKLPPVRKEEEYCADFEQIPYVDPMDRNKSILERQLMVAELKNIRIPREFGYLVDFQVANALRKGYRLCEKNSCGCYDKKKDGDVTAFILIGPSGAGKTTALNASLDYYDQVLTHQGENSRMKQIVYIKVECPPAGSMKTFYDSCIDQMEEVLGYEIPDKKAAKTVDAKERLFKHSAKRWNLGLLVIDEIQNLLVTKNYDKLMNQFLVLSNELKIPIVYIGTEKILNYYNNSELFIKRRLGIEIYAETFKKDFAWDSFMARLWECQWMKEYVPLTKELRDVFYNETGGIINRVISLYENAQVEAIRIGRDTVSGFTPEFIEHISKTLFSLSRNALKAISSEDGCAYSVVEEDIKQMLLSKSDISSKMDLLKQDSSIGQVIVDENTDAMKKDLLRNQVITNVRAWNLWNPKPYDTKEIDKTINWLFRKKAVIQKDEDELTKNVIRILEESRDAESNAVTDSVPVMKMPELHADDFPRFEGVL